MKTEEDEAFDDLARKQGMWGGGFHAKRAAAADKQEPYAWTHTKIEGIIVLHRPADLDRHPDRWEALYKAPPPCPTCESLARAVMLDQTSHDTIPPKREWVGLTDEEIHKADPLPHVMFDQQRIDFAQAIEAKLKEKNNG